MATTSNILQKSLEWVPGTPELPGIKRRLYYISKSLITAWPTLPHATNGRPTSSAYSGAFVLAADAKWQFIDIDPLKSQLTSEAQGEAPSQTQLNKLNAVHPSTGADATAASCYINNDDIVYIVEDMKGNFRVVGSPLWPTVSKVSQDNGQGATGTASTTIAVEASDEIAAPFYKGPIETVAGTINPAA